LFLNIRVNLGRFGWKIKGGKAAGKGRRRLVDSGTINITDVGCKGVNWIHLAQRRALFRAVVSTVMNVRVPYNAGSSGLRTR
jgi:hypothetical protein